MLIKLFLVALPQAPPIDPVFWPFEFSEHPTCRGPPQRAGPKTPNRHAPGKGPGLRVSDIVLNRGALRRSPSLKPQECNMLTLIAAALLLASIIIDRRSRKVIGNRAKKLRVLDRSLTVAFWVVCLLDVSLLIWRNAA